MACVHTDSVVPHDAKRLARLYLLATPDGVYIGVTSRPLRQRMIAHRSAMLHAVAQGQQLSPLHQALYALEQERRRPQLRLITCCTVTEAAQREVMLIAQMRAAGMRLLNRSPGGDGGIVRYAEDCVTVNERMLVISRRNAHSALNRTIKRRLVIARKGRLLHIIWYHESGVRLAWIVDEHMMSMWIQRRGENVGTDSGAMWRGTVIRMSDRTLSLIALHQRTVVRLDMYNDGDLTICRFRDLTKHDHLLRVATSTLIAFACEYHVNVNRRRERDEEAQDNSERRTSSNTTATLGAF